MSSGSERKGEKNEGDVEIEKLFSIGKKKKKTKRSPAEISAEVESLMAELAIAVEEDNKFNEEGKPAINKLKKISLLTDVLSKRQLQHEFLDQGILTLLKNWLDPLPDGSYPNMNILAAVFQILNDFPIDLEQHDQREQLKKSGLGKVIMSFSKSKEETRAKKLAQELVNKWSRSIFNKSTSFADMKNFEVESISRKPPAKKLMSKAASMSSTENKLDVAEFLQGHTSGQSCSKQRAAMPEAMSMDFVVRPPSKVDPDVRARAKGNVQVQRHAKLTRKLEQMRAPKRKQLQATKLSVNGRGMVKYI